MTGWALRTPGPGRPQRSEEHTSELQSPCISYAVFCLKKKIRLGQFIAPDMVAVRLTQPFPFVVVGSPDYLQRCGRPERVEDLREHACLRLRRSNGALAPWAFIDGDRRIEAVVSGPLIASDYPTLLGAARR